MLSKRTGMDIAYLAELSNELATHAARRRRRTDISRNGYGANVAFLCSLAYSGGDSHSLRTGPDGICCILNVGALEDLAARQK